MSDLAVLRDQPELFGAVASHPTVWRTLDRVAADELGGAGAGATHGPLDALRARGIAFSVGFDLTAKVRAAIADLDEAAWVSVPDPEAGNRAARRAKPKRWRPAAPERPRPQVAELDVDLAGWPDGARLIARREARSPGDQTQVDDVDGYRLSVFLTDCGDDVLTLDRRHRHHAHVEQRIRDAKDTGLATLPHYDLALNAVWLELVMCAQALTAWSQRLLLSDALARASPKTLRQRLWHTAARVTRHARRTVVHYQRSWPWTPDLLAAFDRLAVLPPAPG